MSFFLNLFRVCDWKNLNLSPLCNLDSVPQSLLFGDYIKNVYKEDPTFEISGDKRSLYSEIDMSEEVRCFLLGCPVCA